MHVFLEFFLHNSVATICLMKRSACYKNVHTCLLTTKGICAPTNSRDLPVYNTNHHRFSIQTFIIFSNIANTKIAHKITKNVWDVVRFYKKLTSVKIKFASHFTLTAKLKNQKTVFLQNRISIPTKETYTSQHLAVLDRIYMYYCSIS